MGNLLDCSLLRALCSLALVHVSLEAVHFLPQPNEVCWVVECAVGRVIQEGKKLLVLMQLNVHITRFDLVAETVRVCEV